MPAVLFVCTANICRSPMAMALFRARLGEEAKNWRVESAGTWAPTGMLAATFTRMVLSRRGIDLGEHRSRGVDRDLLTQFDLILVMERGHKEALQSEFPYIRERVYLLSEMIGQVYDIQDPIGRSLEDYLATAQEIENIFDRGMAEIKRLAGK